MWEDKIELCLTSIYHGKLFPDPKPIEKDSCDEQTWSWVNPVTCKKDRSGMGIHVSQYLQLSFVGTDRIVGTSSNFRCMDPQSSTLGQAARRCRSSPGMLPIGTNCIQLLELMSINLSMATTWQSDIRYHSESQWRSHIYIVAKHVVFFWFSFWEWEELNSEELLGAWWCHVHPSHFASKMFSWHPKMSHIARLDLIGSLDAYHVLCRSLSNLQSRWDMAEMFQGLLPFWMSSRLADEWISGFGWIGFLLASVNKGLIKWQERTQKCLLWYTNIYYKYWSFSRTYWCFYVASFSKDFCTSAVIDFKAHVRSGYQWAAHSANKSCRQMWLGRSRTMRSSRSGWRCEISVKTIIESGIKMW